jgi:hypothetical protein
MNAQALSLFDQPRARPSDPSTSHLAAAVVQPGNDDAVAYIRKALERYGPLTHEQIATEVMRAQPGRWLHGSIVSAAARAGLHEWDRDLNSRGRQVIVWSLTSREDADEGVQTVELKTDAL